MAAPTLEELRDETARLETVLADRLRKKEQDMNLLGFDIEGDPLIEPETPVPTQAPITPSLDPQGQSIALPADIETGESTGAPVAPLPLEPVPEYSQADIELYEELGTEFDPGPKSKERHLAGIQLKKRMEETGMSAQELARKDAGLPSQADMEDYLNLDFGTDKPKPLSPRELAFRDEGVELEPGGFVSDVYKSVMRPVGRAAKRAIHDMTEEEVFQQEYLDARKEAQGRKVIDTATREAQEKDVADIEAGDYGLEAPADIPITPEAGEAELHAQREAEAQQSLERLPDIKTGKLAKLKAEEIKEDVTELVSSIQENWSVPGGIAETLTGTLAEDAPILVLGFGGLGLIKTAMTTGMGVQKARKIIKIQKSLQGLTVTERTAVLEQQLGPEFAAISEQLVQTLPKHAKALIAISKFPAKYPRLSTAASLLAETGILLTPHMIREEDMPSLEQTLIAGGLVGLLKYVGGKIRKAKIKAGEVPEPSGKTVRLLKGKPGAPGVEPASPISPGVPPFDVVQRGIQGRVPVVIKKGAPKVPVIPKEEPVPDWVTEGVTDEEVAAAAWMEEQEIQTEWDAWQIRLDEFGDNRALAQKMATYIKFNGHKKSKGTNLYISEHITKKPFGTSSDELATIMGISEPELMERLSELPTMPKAVKPKVEKVTAEEPAPYSGELPAPAESNSYVAALPKGDIKDSGLATKERWKNVEEPKALKNDDWILVFDVDYFKPVNEEFGHDAGDLVRDQIARYFAASFPDAVVANPGGDEFAGVFKNLPDERVLQAFVTDFPKAVTVEGQPLTFSGGIQRGKTGKKLNADTTAGLAKKTGKNRLIVDIDGKRIYYKGAEVDQPYVTEYQSKEFIRLGIELGKKSEKLSPEVRSAVERALQKPGKPGEKKFRGDPEGLEKTPSQEKPGKEPPDLEGQKGAITLPTKAELKEAYVRGQEWAAGARGRLPKNVMVIYDKWRAETQVRTFRLARVVNQLRQGTSKPERELATFLREKTGVPEALGRKDLEKLFDNTEKQMKSQKLADIAGKTYDEFIEYFTEHLEEVPKEWIENYVNHVWDIPRKNVNKVIKWFSTRNPNLNKRFISTLQEGIEKFGLKPKTLDIADLLSLYGQNAINTTENKLFLDALTALEDAEGAKLILPVSKAPNEWKTIDHPALNRYTYRGKGPKLEKMPVKFHPDLAPVMETVFQAPWSPGGKTELIVNSFEALNALYKQTNLMLSLFHHMALGEAAVAAMGFRKTAMVALNLMAMKRALFDGKFAMFLDKWEVAQDAVEHTLMLGANLDVQKALVDKLIEVSGEAMDKFPLEMRGFKLGSVARGVGWGKEKWDQALWDYYHNNLKLMAYEHILTKELAKWNKNLLLKEQFGKSFLSGPQAKKQMTTGLQPMTSEYLDALKTEIAIFVNDTFGGQNLKAKMTSPTTMRLLRGGLLSPDWLNSTMRQAASIFGYGARDKRFIKFRIKTGVKFWTRAALYFGGGTMMWNYLRSQIDDAEERGVPWSEGKGTIENDPGHETHVLWSRNEEGQKIYLRQGKQFREAPEFLYDAAAGEFSPLTATLKKLGGKASPMIHMGLAITTGKTAGGYEVPELRDVEGWKKAAALTKYVATSWLPFSFGALRDERKEFDPIQFIFPTSKGMTPFKTQKYFKWAIIKGDTTRVKRIYKAAEENNLTDIDLLFNRAYGEAKMDANEELERELKKDDVTEEQINAMTTNREIEAAAKILSQKLSRFKKLELFKNRTIVNEVIRAWIKEEKIMTEGGPSGLERKKALLRKKSKELQEYLK